MVSCNKILMLDCVKEKRIPSCIFRTPSQTQFPMRTYQTVYTIGKPQGK